MGQRAGLRIAGVLAVVWAVCGVGLVWAEDPWLAVLRTHTSGGCSRSYYHDSSDTSVRLNLGDPTAPALSIERETMSVIGSREIGSGGRSPSYTWSKKARTFEGRLVSSVSGGASVWELWMVSEETWVFSGGAPSAEQLATTPPQTSARPTDKDPDLTLTCTHDWLALGDGERVVSLGCRVKDSLGNSYDASIRGFLDAGGATQIYLTQDPKGLEGEQMSMFDDDGGDVVWRRPVR